jgi:hypothetical protein
MTRYYAGGARQQPAIEPVKGQVHDRHLVEEPVVIGDVRGNERYLRVTWHPDTGTMVFSHWNGPVCSASTPVHLADATKVIDLVVRALKETVERQPSVPHPVQPPRLDWLEKLRRVAGPSVARVLALGRPGASPAGQPTERVGNDSAHN